MDINEELQRTISIFKEQKNNIINQLNKEVDINNKMNLLKNIQYLDNVMSEYYTKTIKSKHIIINLFQLK